MVKLKFIFWINIGMLFFISDIEGQNLSLSGRFMDSDDTASLIGVTVILTNPLDTSKSGWTTSDGNGNFIISNLYPGIYSLRASYIGYKTNYINKITVNADKNIGVIL